MNPENVSKITNFANDLYVLLRLNTPVDIEQVVYSLNGKIEHDKTIEHGKLRIEKLKNSTQDFTIYIKEVGTDYDYRFTLAHAVGHLFIHMGYLINTSKWNDTNEYRDSAYYRYGHSIEEYEANLFAEKLMMPRREFLEILKSNLHDGFYDTESVSNFFEVPIDSVIRRGRYLGII